MGDRLRNFLAWGVLSGALFSLAARAGNDEFFDTTGGTILENTGKFNGIDENEAITKKGQEILNRFRDGRKSSNVTQTSRYSKILEHHDEDFDGVTDHANGANALEGAMEGVALKGQKLSGDKRKAALDKAREDEAYKKCVKNAKPEEGASVEDVCGNPSSIIVNKGAAHGKDEADAHRVYELKKEAYEKAKAAGKMYGDRAVAEAGEWGDDPTPEGTKGIKDADGRIRSMRVKNAKTGGEDVVKIAPDIDLMKSEYSYLEQLKDYQTNLEWKSMRAARLAGSESDPDTIKQFAGIWGKKGMSDDQKQAEVAQRIEEMQSVGQERVCILNNGSDAKLLQEEQKCQTNPANKIFTLNEAYSDSKYQRLRPTLDALRKKARATSNKEMTADGRKKQKADVAQINNCLNRDVFCYGPDAANKVAGQTGGDPEKLKYQAAKGDPGITYKNTREYTMNRLSAANAGGIDNFMKVMTNSDFSASTDNKTDTKPFAQMKAEWEAAKKAADIVQGKQKDAIRQKGLDKNPNGYKGQQFDTKNMNTVKLFGRMRGRDGTTFQTEAMPGPGGMPPPGAPVGPPRRRAPGAVGGGVGAPTALPGRQ